MFRFRSCSGAICVILVLTLFSVSGCVPRPSHFFLHFILYVCVLFFCMLKFYRAALLGHCPALPLDLGLGSAPETWNSLAWCSGLLTGASKPSGQATTQSPRVLGWPYRAVWGPDSWVTIFFSLQFGAWHQHSAALSGEGCLHSLSNQLGLLS